VLLHASKLNHRAVLKSGLFFSDIVFFRSRLDIWIHARIWSWLFKPVLIVTQFVTVSLLQNVLRQLYFSGKDYVPDMDLYGPDFLWS